MLYKYAATIEQSLQTLWNNSPNRLPLTGILATNNYMKVA